MKKNAKKKALKHTHIPKVDKKKNINKISTLNTSISNSMARVSKALSSTENKKIENLQQMYALLQDEMAVYLLNLKDNDKENEESSLTPDEKIKEFENMLKIFIKFESLSRKLEKQLNIQFDI